MQVASCKLSWNMDVFKLDSGLHYSYAHFLFKLEHRCIKKKRHPFLKDMVFFLLSISSPRDTEINTFWKGSYKMIFAVIQTKKPLHKQGAFYRYLSKCFIPLWSSGCIPLRPHTMLFLTSLRL